MADTDILVVGAGFAGLSVASRLGDLDHIVVDRGERFDPAAARLDLHFTDEPWERGDLSGVVKSELHVMRSARPTEQVSLPLSALSANVYSYRQGGVSNWWGGYSKRITAECFAQDGVLAWPIGLDELDPYYREAEQLLRVHGDPRREDVTVFAAMPGWQLWREYLDPVFPGAHVTSEAKNVSDMSGQTSMGFCTGNGHCAVCGNDAKARPDTVFPLPTVNGNTMIREIIFEGSKAVAARCTTDGEDFDISFDRLVVAAGGLENVALLRRSGLPAGVPRDLIGRHYQDHTACEMIVRMPSPMPYYEVGAECHAEVPELSGFIHGLEVKTLILSIPPEIDQLRQFASSGNLVDVLNLKTSADCLARLYLQIEVPPEWDLRVRSRGQEAYLYTMPYYRHFHVLDQLVSDVVSRLVRKGLQVIGVIPYYRSAFGGHHYSGITPMSRTDRRVVAPDHRLVGTDNVFLSGASVMPRCGGAGPTLSIVATGLRLGDLLIHGSESR